MNTDLDVVVQHPETPLVIHDPRQGSMQKLDLTGIETSMPKKLTPQIGQKSSKVLILSGSTRLEKNSDNV